MLRESLESLGEMLTKADAVKQAQETHITIKFARDPQTVPLEIPDPYEKMGIMSFDRLVC